MISEYIKDEVPKAPIYLYSIKNSNNFDSQDEHYETKRAIEALNNSLWLTELSSIVDVVMPMDPLLSIDETYRAKYLGRYIENNKFH